MLEYRIHSIRQTVHHHSHKVNLMDPDIVTVMVRVNRPLEIAGSFPIHQRPPVEENLLLLEYC